MPEQDTQHEQPAVGEGEHVAQAPSGQAQTGQGVNAGNGQGERCKVAPGAGARRCGGTSGIDRPAAAMLVASVAALPIGIQAAFPALGSPLLLAAAVGVVVSSSVIPYVCYQLAMRRLPRATFALLLSLLLATTTAIGLLKLRQVSTPTDLLGIALVIGGVALHRPRHRAWKLP